MRTVVVTGANGFIGQHCLESLIKQNARVHAVSRSEKRESTLPGVIWHKCDLLSEDPYTLLQSIKATHLLHLAWCTEHGAYWTSPLNESWLEASIQLVKSFHRAGGKRFVTAGTCAEYKWLGECQEGVTPEEPSSPYGKSKKLFTEFLDSYRSQSGLSTGVGRVFHLYGPNEGSKRLMPIIINALLTGKKAPCSAGTQLRDYMYVKDVAGALVAFLFSEVTGVVNISTGLPVSIRDILGTIERLVGASGLIQYGVIPRGDSDPDLLYGSAERLNKEVGFTARYTLEEGLTESIQFIKSSLELNK